MNTNRIAIVSLVILLFTSPIALAQNDSSQQSGNADKEADIRYFLLLTGADKLGDQVMESMIEHFKASFPPVDDEYWKSLKEKMNMGELIDLIVPIYSKYLTHEDIKVMISFYKTPTGKRVIKTLPAITADSMKVGESWGRKIAQQIVEDMKNRK